MSELAGSLLQVITASSNQRGRSVPLMMEFLVDPHLNPILVSSTRGVLWISQRDGRVRAALRAAKDFQGFPWRVVESVFTRGQQEGWGNVHPLTKEGILGAIDYVRSFDMEDLEILAHPKIPWGNICEGWKGGRKRSMTLAVLGLPLQPAPWLPLNTVLVVPKDRSFVGFAFLYQERFAAVVHNASRGIGVVTGGIVPTTQQRVVVRRKKTKA